MYLCRDIIGTSLSNIGFYFGGRDHSTVIHAVKSIDRKKEKDKAKYKSEEVPWQHKRLFFFCLSFGINWGLIKRKIMKY